MTLTERWALLMRMGKGLPIDALKRNTVEAISCTSVLDESEVSHLSAVLPKNESLLFINLSGGGFDPDDVGGAGYALLEAIASPEYLPNLQTLVLPQQCTLRVDALRKGSEAATAALTSADGPWNMSSLESLQRTLLATAVVFRKRKHLPKSTPDPEAEAILAEATRALQDVLAGKLPSRRAFAQHVTSLIVDGRLGHGQLKGFFRWEVDLRHITLKQGRALLPSPHSFGARRAFACSGTVQVRIHAQRGDECHGHDARGALGAHESGGVDVVWKGV